MTFSPPLLIATTDDVPSRKSVAPKMFSSGELEAAKMFSSGGARLGKMLLELDRRSDWSSSGERKRFSEGKEF